MARRYGFDPNAHHERLFGENDLPWISRQRIPNSRAALNVAELAREQKVHEPLHQRLMTGYWAEDLDISDPTVLADEGAAVGLDRGQVVDVATTFPYQDRITASTRAVHEMGANGVPAFVVADRVLIPGAQPRELFEKVMQKLEIESVDPTDDSLSERS